MRPRCGENASGNFEAGAALYVSLPLAGRGASDENIKRRRGVLRSEKETARVDHKPKQRQDSVRGLQLCIYRHPLPCIAGMLPRKKRPVGRSEPHFARRKPSSLCGGNRRLRAEHVRYQERRIRAHVSLRGRVTATLRRNDGCAAPSRERSQLTAQRAQDRVGALRDSAAVDGQLLDLGTGRVTRARFSVRLRQKWGQNDLPGLNKSGSFHCIMTDLWAPVPKCVTSIRPARATAGLAIVLRVVGIHGRVSWRRTARSHRRGTLCGVVVMGWRNLDSPCPSWVAGYGDRCRWAALVESRRTGEGLEPEQ